MRTNILILKDENGSNIGTENFPVQGLPEPIRSQLLAYGIKEIDLYLYPVASIEDETLHLPSDALNNDKGLVLIHAVGFDHVSTVTVMEKLVVLTVRRSESNKGFILYRDGIQKKYFVLIVKWPAKQVAPAPIETSMVVETPKKDPVQAPEVATVTEVEVRTKDCVEAIIAFTGEKKNWKRVAKYRGDDVREYENFGDSIEDRNKTFWIREFINEKDPDTIAFVWSVEDKVIEVRVLQKGGDPKDLFKDHYGSLYLKEDGDHIATTPMVKEDELWERQDFENHDVVRFDGNIVVIRHGGDWQEPLQVDYRLMSDGKLYHIHNSIVENTPCNE